MGGSGSGYKGMKLTSEDIQRAFRKKKEESDAYLFDVEYEKLKQERERLEKELERQREEFRRISEELQREMANGTATKEATERFMAALTDRGVQLQQQQEKLQKDIDESNEQRADIENQMNELRRKAFSGSTHANEISRDTQYNGFKLDNAGKGRYASAKIIEMSPQEYLRRVAFGSHGGNVDALLRSASPSMVARYMRQMLRGTKFNAPTMNARNGTSMGFERAIAAVMNGYKRIPVMVIEE